MKQQHVETAEILKNNQQNVRGASEKERKMEKKQKRIPEAVQ
jgi:hypothetical protein